LTPSVSISTPTISTISAKVVEEEEDKISKPNSLVRCFGFEYWVRDILQFIDHFKMLEGIDFPLPAGDLHCFNNVSYTRAVTLARELCTTTDTIAVYGTDCSRLWIKSLKNSGSPVRLKTRITFGLF